MADWETASPLIQRYESGGQNIKNPTSSAFGPWQILDSTWRSAAPGLGISLAQYPTAGAAPVPVQEQVAKRLFETQGYAPWAPYNPKLAQAIGWSGGGGAKTTMFDPELGRDVPYVRIASEPRDPSRSIDQMLDALLAVQPQQQAEAQPDDHNTLLDMLLEPPAAPGSTQQAGEDGGAPIGQAGPAFTPAPPPAAETLPTGQIKPVGKTDLLDQLLAGSTGLQDREVPTIEPPARGQQIPDLPTAIPPGRAPNLLDQLLRYAQTSIEALGEAPAGIAKGAGDIGQMIAGLTERAGLGEQAAVTGQPMGEGTIPLEPGARAIGGLTDFATGGFTAPHGVPPGAGRSAAAVGAEAKAAIPGVLADVRGGPRKEPPPIRGKTGEVVPLRTKEEIDLDQVPWTAEDTARFGEPWPGYAEGAPMPMRAVTKEGETLAANDPGGGGGKPPEPPVGGGGPPGAEPPHEKFPLLDPPEPGEGVKQIATRIDDALHRVLGNNTADKITATHWWNSLPRKWKDPKLRAFMADDIERRMADPTAPLDPRTEEFLSGPGAELVSRENKLANRARELLGPDAQHADLPTASEGYVHRVVENPKGGRREEVLVDADPERARTTDVITGRGRSLSRFASSMQARAPRFVLQDAQGNRVWSKATLDDQGYQYGQKVQSGGKEWEVKPPTMAEVEANTPIRYVRDYPGNLLTNVLRLHRIVRNAELLRDLKAELREKGLFHEDRRMIGQEGAVETWVRTGPRPEGLTGEINLPQMRGWTDPKIANVLNDFWNASGGSLDNFMSKANRFLMSWLFATPVPHALNVGAHWTVGRGWDWLSVPAYIRGAKAGAKALNAVWNLTPEYTRALREGTGVLYGDVRMENFYNMLMRKTWSEQLRDPQMWEGYAKSLGLKGVRDLVRAEYRWSRKTLWAINDMLLLQRQFELEARGIPTRQAIQQAEKDIPNYRIPSEVLGSHAVAQALKSPNWLNFGRYKYGQINALRHMVNDMIGKNATPRERWEGVGKLTVLGTIATMGYPALDALLQGMTGNENAKARRAGPFALIEAMRGLSQGDKEWAAAMSSFITPAPLLEAATEVIHNKDWLGRDIIDPRASGPGMAIQGAEALARQFYPAQLGMQAMGEGGVAQAAGNLIGLNLPPKAPGASGRTEKMLRGRARGRERKDPVANKLRDIYNSVVGP